MVVHKLCPTSGGKARIIVRTSNGCFMKVPKPKRFTVVKSSGKGVIIYCWRDAIGRFCRKPRK